MERTMQTIASRFHYKQVFFVLMQKSSGMKTRLEETGLKEIVLMRALTILHVYACGADGQRPSHFLPYPLESGACPEKEGIKAVAEYLNDRGMQSVWERFQAWSH
jgi:hypothetical protein